MPTVAMTVEQAWHPVPGGTAVSVLESLRALRRRSDVRVVGVAAWHRHRPPPPWDVPGDVRHVPLPRSLLYPAWQYLRAPAVQRVTGRVDVVHASTFAVPPKGGASLAVTVHDLAFRRRPDHFTRNGLRFFERGLSITRREADMVICPSRATADDCLHAGLDGDRLRVVPHGVRVPDVTADEVQAFRDRHRLSRPYVMWSGTLEPRKNVGGLIRAFERLRASGEDVDLVLVGPRGWGQDQVSTAASNSTHVRLLGFLPERELHVAYAGAAAFAYPSTWEGFGLPVLEAMAHGIPVVTSRGTAMAEFVGDGGVLVDPQDEDEIASALQRAIGPEHEVLAAGARRAAGSMTWASAAERLAEIYRLLS